MFHCIIISTIYQQQLLLIFSDYYYIFVTYGFHCATSFHSSFVLSLLQ